MVKARMLQTRNAATFGGLWLVGGWLVGGWLGGGWLFFGSANAHGTTFESFATGADQFTMEFVTIGDPGNAPDTAGVPELAGTVDYVYRIGKYEVSREIVSKANAEGELGITLDWMDVVSGIFGEGPRPTMPATGVSWNEAARFVNWLNTSQGFPPAYKFSTHPGDVGYDPKANISLWESGDAGFRASNPFRNHRARYFLPSADELYKAAFYDPHANGGTGGYWEFATGSDTPPVVVSDGTAAGTTVYEQAFFQGPADVTSAGGLSPYGVMGLGGNVWELEETAFDFMHADGSSRRGIRGGDWSDNSRDISTMRRLSVPPDDERMVIGFRVVSIPEPSALVLVGWGVFAFWSRRPALWSNVR